MVEETKTKTSTAAASANAPAAKVLDPIESRKRKIIFFCLFMLTILVNYDSGAVPAVLDYIAADFKLSYGALGLLGSLPYIGLTVFSPVSGYLLQKFSAKKVVVTLLFLNILSAVLFAFSPETVSLFITRLAIGCTQASFIIYAPVWVDEFAPDATRTIWLGCIQAAVGLGVMVGYAAAGFFAISIGRWEAAILLQAVLMAPFCLYLAFVPVKDFDCSTNPQTNPAPSSDSTAIVNRRASRIDSVWSAKPETVSVWVQLKLIFSNKIFMCTVFSLCSLFFVVTGIQFWITEYLLRFIVHDKPVVLAVFAAVAATGPTVGVFMGGFIVDRMGGYKGAKGTLVALKCCVVFAILSCVTGIPAGYIFNFPIMISLIWLLLAFGGAILPAATGVIMSSVPLYMRSFSSAVSMLIYNVLGYAGGSFLPGIVMDATAGQPGGGLLLGFRIVLYWAIFGFLGVLGCHHFAKKAVAALESNPEMASAAAAAATAAAKDEMPAEELKDPAQISVKVEDKEFMLHPDIARSHAAVVRGRDFRRGTFMVADAVPADAPMFVPSEQNENTIDVNGLAFKSEMVRIRRFSIL
eukprot:GILI01007410.1.p1 GENE.GILI01007410.1~~GILI01007410.1.p1  ORF type:complete len:579 (+),score=197.95 GILI01007410.1:84-1820(+)